MNTQLSVYLANMAAMDAPMLSGVEPLDTMNSLHQELPPAPPLADQPVSPEEISFASQTRKREFSYNPNGSVYRYPWYNCSPLAASQSAALSHPAPFRPIQTNRPPPPHQTVDRSLTELGDRGEAVVKQVRHTG